MSDTRVGDEVSVKFEYSECDANSDHDKDLYIPFSVYMLGVEEFKVVDKHAKQCK